jgi:hypothetical protein
VKLRVAAGLLPEASMVAQLNRIEEMLQGVVDRLDVLVKGKRKEP